MKAACLIAALLLAGCAHTHDEDRAAVRCVKAAPTARVEGDRVYIEPGRCREWVIGPSLMTPTLRNDSQGTRR